MSSNQEATVEIPFRPPYIGGTGPPMAPLTLRPPHDESNPLYIADQIDWAGVPSYVVSSKKNNAYRKLVRKQDILEWVSQRTLEDFEFGEAEKYAEEEWLQEEELLRKANKVIDKRNAKKALNAKALARDDDQREQKKPRGRPRKHSEESDTAAEQNEEVTTNSSAPVGKFLKRKRVVEEEEITMPRKQSVLPTSQTQHRLSHTPSLSTPLKVGQFEVLLDDTDMEDVHEREFEDDLPVKISSANHPQKKRIMGALTGRNKPSVEATSRVTRSRTDSISAPTSPSGIRQDSRRLDSRLSKTSKQLTNRQKSTDSLASKVLASPSKVVTAKWSAVNPPPTPSRHALEIYEDLERQKSQDTMRSSRRPSQFSEDELVAQPKHKSKGKGKEKANATQKKSPEAKDKPETDQEAEWEVRCILSHKDEVVDGNHVRYYYIDWAGDQWEPTWEPEFNVSDETIAEYEASVVQKMTKHPSAHGATTPGPSNTDGKTTKRSSGHDGQVTQQKRPSPVSHVEEDEMDEMDELGEGRVTLVETDDEDEDGSRSDRSYGVPSWRNTWSAKPWP